MKVSSKVFSAIILLALASIFLTPLAAIWALNALFPTLAIPYTFETWLAALALYLISKQNISISKD